MDGFIEKRPTFVRGHGLHLDDYRPFLSPSGPPEIRAALEDRLSELPERHARIFRARLDGRHLKDIGEEMSLSAERVRQLEFLVMGRLRHVFAAFGITGED
jgi:DNA-directed RNA polymerase specialized sigma24 family protein